MQVMRHLPMAKEIKASLSSAPQLQVPYCGNDYSRSILAQ